MTSIGSKPAVLFLGLALGCDAMPESSTAAAPLSAPAVNAEAPPQQSRESPSDTRSSLTVVTDPSLVCMVNNHFMGRPQIPVEVDGRTYYGCCEMCEGRLRSDSASRSAIDPVSGNTVDKATALIARTADGRTFYFESERTFAAREGRSGG